MTIRIFTIFRGKIRQIEGSVAMLNVYPYSKGVGF